MAELHRAGPMRPLRGGSRPSTSAVRLWSACLLYLSMASLALAEESVRGQVVSVAGGDVVTLIDAQHRERRQSKLFGGREDGEGGQELPTVSIIKAVRNIENLEARAALREELTRLIDLVVVHEPEVFMRGVPDQAPPFRGRLMLPLRCIAPKGWVRAESQHPQVSKRLLSISRQWHHRRFGSVEALVSGLLVPSQAERRQLDHLSRRRKVAVPKMAELLDVASSHP